MYPQTRPQLTARTLRRAISDLRDEPTWKDRPGFIALWGACLDVVNADDTVFALAPVEVRSAARQVCAHCENAVDLIETNGRRDLLDAHKTRAIKLGRTVLKYLGNA